MGVRGRRWEVQFHPGTGGEVRRWFVSQALLLFVATAAGLALAVMLVLVALLPSSARAAVTRLSAGPVQRQNAALHRELAGERERAMEMAAQVEQVLQRGRRLCWTLGASEASVAAPIAPLPPVSADALEVAAWLEAHGQRLDSLADVVAGQTEVQRPCPLLTLPTAPPVEPSRAVPVAAFGWQISPFTGREEAHHGVTLAAPAGEAVRAPGAGRIVYAGRPRDRRANEWMRWGTIVVIDHGCERLTLLGHLGDLSVRPGATVRRGDRLGSVGESGWTRVPALYLEVRWPVGGKIRPIDPAMVALWLRLDDPEARFADPAAGLPETFSALDTLRLAR